ncbi:hypothetical protein CEP54_001337 [Fusarium duplospermum]|uniref:Protein kinase domain-containing protein n=1 Tax=Fusarium duplospermum TaxID=1325734 RepID=A0A428R1Z6_9HYPO|nr:hypothetical protein CEP54_001337 [Fusarium duplospermum]
MAPNPINDKVDVLAHTRFSFVYVLRDDQQSILKGGAIWIDGKPYGSRPGSENSSSDLQREARIYEALGEHERIISYRGTELHSGTNEAWALRLERAPYGSLRQHIVHCLESPSEKLPDMHTRLRIAIDFAEGVQHIHDCDVLWGDVSTRNALLFDDFRIKLCDFAGSRLKGVFDDITYEYETRYCPPGPEKDSPAVGTMERELFALGSAIYEITEWNLPYGVKADEEDLDKALGRGERPELSPDNPADGIIMRCWEFKFGSAQDIAIALNAMLMKLK